MSIRLGEILTWIAHLIPCLYGKNVFALNLWLRWRVGYLGEGASIQFCKWGDPMKNCSVLLKETGSGLEDIHSIATASRNWPQLFIEQLNCAGLEPGRKCVLACTFSSGSAVNCPFHKAPKPPRGEFKFSCMTGWKGTFNILFRPRPSRCRRCFKCTTSSLLSFPNEYAPMLRPEQGLLVSPDRLQRLS